MNSQPQKLPQKLPIGIQSFSEMRKNGYRYVDKTPNIAELVERGKYYFLSRPRRFGKSLLVDTLDCAFSARKELFNGLFLASKDANWSWERKSPVLRIDFSGGTIENKTAMETHLHRIIDTWETQWEAQRETQREAHWETQWEAQKETAHHHASHTAPKTGSPTKTGSPSEQAGTGNSPGALSASKSPQSPGAPTTASRHAPPNASPGHRLLSFIPKLAEKTGEQVVILIDEYDKPILDNLNNPEEAGKIRNVLRDFYGAIKPLDEHLRFVLLTGVSKFAKAGIFSGLNNLHDITLSRRYSTLCGYRQHDLETVFADLLEHFDKDMVRTWYNGYSWAGEPVYNPFDILLLFEEGEYRPWWFETGTPSFLTQLLKNKPRTLPDFEGMSAGNDILGSFEIDNQKPETLLFQAGYLTIKDVVSNPQTGTRYTLGFPNREVRESFSRLMLTLLNVPETMIPDYPLRRLMEKGDTTSLHKEMQAFFAAIPYTWHTKSPIAEYEGYYASVAYAYFASIGYEVIPEDTTNRGRADMTVKTDSNTWIFEFKVRDLDKSGDKSPLEQIKERGYAEKYISSNLPIHQIGIVFDPKKRSIESWETETREVG